MTFRVVHVPFTFAPDPVGGTEIYVEALAHELRRHEIESMIVAPSNNGLAETYEHNGLRVRRFVSPNRSNHMLRELYGDGDPQAATAFAQILDEERPDAVHLHAFTRAVSLLLVRASKQRKLPVFFTYHTPTVSCQRGTLMLRDRETCDGVLSVSRCTSCSLEGQSVPGPAAHLLSYFPRRFARSLETFGLSGGIWTALRMVELIQTRHTALRGLLSEVDGIVALREWVHGLLVRNGVPEAKIILSGHGLPGGAPVDEPFLDIEARPLRVAFLGRTDRVKGVDTLLRVMGSLPGLDLELHLYGVVQGTGDEKYWARLQHLAAHDQRIKFLPPSPHESVISLLRRYHLLAVPSRCLETGPLVILEAFAAGTPVIGANLGGISESVRHKHNGLLLNPYDVHAWSDAFRQCAGDRTLLSTLRRGVKKPRSMTNVATEMAQLYFGFVGRQADKACDRVN